MLSYHSGSPRIFRPDAFIIDDSAFNCWGSFNGEKVSILVDGKEVGTKKAASPRIDPRNSLFRFGRLTLGDRHIVELAAEEAEFTGFDATNLPKPPVHLYQLTALAGRPA